MNSRCPLEYLPPLYSSAESFRKYCFWDAVCPANRPTVGPARCRSSSSRTPSSFFLLLIPGERNNERSSLSCSVATVTAVLPPNAGALYFPLELDQQPRVFFIRTLCKLMGAWLPFSFSHAGRRVSQGQELRGNCSDLFSFFRGGTFILFAGACLVSACYIYT